MTIDHLTQLVQEATQQRCETQHIELKKAEKGVPLRLFDTLSSFANQPGGGIILFGIDEKSGYIITGVYDAQDLQNKVSEQALQMEPQLRPMFTVAKVEGKTVVAAEISECEAHEKPCFYKGRGRLKGSYVRVGERDEPMTEYEVYSYEAFKRKLQDELRPVERADLDDFDPNLLQDYFIRLRREKPNLAKETNERIMALLGYVDKRTGQPTIAGLLLFGRYPQVYFPQLSITAMALEGREFGELGSRGERFLDNKRIEGTIPQMVEETLAFVRRNTATATIITDGQRADRADYPLTAVREIVLNALIHRDYSLHTDGSPVQVILYADRLEIENPGGLYGRITLDQLGKAKADTRNPCIAQALETMGISENRYSGIPTVRREMAEASLPQPRFENTGGVFRVTLFKEKPSVTEEDLLEFCHEPRSREEIAAFLEMSTVYHVTKKYVKPLVEQGKLAMTIPEKPQSLYQKYVAVKTSKRF